MASDARHEAAIEAATKAICDEVDDSSFDMLEGGKAEYERAATAAIAAYGAGLAGAPLGPQGSAPASETGNPAPDAPTQLGSEDWTPNSTAGKLAPASPDDRGGER